MTITSLDLSFLNSRSSLVFTPLLAALFRCSRAFYFPELFYFLRNQTDGFGRKLLIEASYGTLNFTYIESKMVYANIGFNFHWMRKENFGRDPKKRPRKTLEETVRKDLEYLDLTEDMTQN
ncbi:hypothetical protein DVH24_007043 [Malus domestica]|uniref:Uncharacterized protein n=1 Tax=Malus domestica TaxID=3750 RepID=A0A498HK73_MALDO|nr:hypothetical protein DVH24_007043 [Malus domestica]